MDRTMNDFSTSDDAQHATEDVPAESWRSFGSRKRSLVAASMAFVMVWMAGVLSHHRASPTMDRIRPRRLPVRRDYVFTTIDQLRIDIARSSFEMMQQDTLENFEQGGMLDISTFADLMNVALDNIGVRGVVNGLLDARPYANAVNMASYQDDLKLRARAVATAGRLHNMNEIAFYNSPSERKFDYFYTIACSGSVWWLRHYAGAVAADKLRREGSLLLEAGSDTRLETGGEVMAEVRRIMKLGQHEMMPIDFNHGFVWQYIADEYPDMNEYPLDLALEFCAEDFGTEGNIEETGQRVGHECQHGVGHAVWIAMAKRELGYFPVTTAPLPKGEYILSKESICEGTRICFTAPGGDRLTFGDPVYGCLDGLAHSHATLGRNGQYDQAAFEELREMCKAEADS